MAKYVTRLTSDTHNLQLQMFFCPSCVCVSLLPLTGHKTGFPANVRIRTLTVSECSFNNNIDAINISLDDAPCYQHIQRRK